MFKVCFFKTESHEQEMEASVECYALSTTKISVNTNS